MISIDVIEGEIRDLEARGETTYAQCERLAWLYVVRDHIKPDSNTNTTPHMYGSEFLEIASGVSYPDLIRILNDHLETVKILYPKSYEAVLDRIRALKH